MVGVKHLPEASLMSFNVFSTFYCYFSEFYSCALYYYSDVSVIVFKCSSNFSLCRRRVAGLRPQEAQEVEVGLSNSSLLFGPVN